MQSKGGMSLLLVDNVAAFFWLDKAIRAAAPAPGQSRHNTWVLLKGQMFCILLIQQLEAVLLHSCWCLLHCANVSDVLCAAVLELGGVVSII